jgi:hypothetical protein
VLSLFEKQVYPNRVNPSGQPDPPYDVAGWTLPLQMGVETYDIWDIREREKYNRTIKLVSDTNRVRSNLNLKPSKEQFPKVPNPLKTKPRIGLYKPFTSSMDEGWTRLVFDNHQIKYSSVSNEDLSQNRLNYDVIILPADNENTIMNGLNANRYSAEFAGGIGEAGAENLKKFVENGGKLICFDDSCGLVIKRFGLPMKNVLAGVPRSEVYNPGSIVLLDVDTKEPLAKGTAAATPAYFITSSAFDVLNAGGTNPSDSGTQNIKTIAHYASKDTLMSGWMLGTSKIAGKIALAETTYGKGEIVLFAFRPQHRGQTWATFRFVFNALEK